MPVPTRAGNICLKARRMISPTAACFQKEWRAWYWQVVACQPAMMPMHLSEAWDNAWLWGRQQAWQLLRLHQKH